ncbi:MAG: LytR family transcriptional regulator [Solirubrobacteraceae bacterium]|nr:LytR family transcriptional regulator [Solirubrobacteraceae bacterium]
MLKRFALGALIIVVMTAAATATATLLEITADVNIIKHGAKIPGIAGVLDNVNGGGPQTILILGSDRRFIDIKEHNPARSDTILLVRLDPGKPATSVMSIPRDLEVEIPGFGRDKINAAYADGGPRLTVQTIRNLFHFPINHVINVNFGGFREAVDRLGCVYIDVDRRYFNDNNPPAGGGGHYATIDIQPGYQKLCGADALDYVRFRHLDTDFVRAARQQDFLRQAKEQLGLGKLFSSRRQLLKIFARYTQTDIRSTTATLRLLKLAFESAHSPIREVHFRGDIAGDSTLSYVDITPENLALTRSEFLDPRPTTGSRGKGKHRGVSKHGLAPGVLPDGRAARAYVRDLSRHVHFPLLYAAHRLSAGSYATSAPPRHYTIRDRNDHRFHAYRIVIEAPGLGQYYGVQGTTWTTPPILDHPSETRTIGGRRFDLFFDGHRLRLVAYRTRKAVYWVSNTLLESLTNRQMLDIAGSLTRAGG